MAKVELKIVTNFEEASQGFKDLGNLTEAETRRIDKAMKSIKTDSIDSMIQKQERLRVAVTATRGPQEAAIIQQRNLRNGIESLIKKGLDPMDQRLQKARSQYEKVTSEVEKNRAAVVRQKESSKKQEEQTRKNTEAQKKFAAVLNKTYLAILASVVAVTAALAKNTFAVAKNGAEYLKTSRMIGFTVEEFQELQFAATKSGVTTDRFTDSLKDMTEKIGEARVGAGTLNDHLKEVNPTLLEQVKNASSNMDAFNLLANEMASTTNEQDRMILATELFADAGKDMIPVLAGGAEGLNKLREEARKYGIISNENALLSKKFVDTQTILKASFRGIANDLGVKLMPMFIRAGEAMVEFMGSISPEQMEQTGESVRLIFKGILLAGMALAQGINLIFTAMDTQIQNSVGNSFLIVEKLTGFIATQLDSLRTVVGFIDFADVFPDLDSASDTVANLQEISALLAQSKKHSDEAAEQDMVNWANRALAIDSFRQTMDDAFDIEAGDGGAGGGPSLVDPVKLQTEIELLQKHLTTLSDLEAEAHLDRVSEFQTFFEMRKNQAQIGANEQIAFLTEENARVQALTTLSNEQKLAAEQAFQEQMAELRSPETLRSQLRLLQNEESIANEARIAEFEQFFQSRIDQEGVQGEARFQLLQEEFAKTAELRALSNENEIAATVALNNELDRLRDDQTKKEQEAFQIKLGFVKQQIDATASLVSSLSGIMKNAGKESRALAVIEKGIAIAQIGINTAVAVSKALASAPPPANFVAAGVVGAAGIAQSVKVATTPIPTAETGGDFVVPNSAGIGRVDTVPVVANQGETVSVTPRGEESSKNLTVNVILDDEVLYNSVQKGIDSGEITVSSDNIRQVA